MIDIPEAFARTTVEREGAAGTAWLATLPALVADLLDRWGCVPDGELMYGGVGVIVPTRDLVLKVSFPHPGNRYEPDALETWAGRGAVVLHDRDDEHFAMLLERAHPATLAMVADEDEIAGVAGRISHRLAVPAPPHLPRLRDQATTWAEDLERDSRELPHNLSLAALDAARATIRDLGHDQPELLIHGDLNARNILRADREPWLAVDPKGYAGDPAYDAGILLKTRALTILPAAEPAKGLQRCLDIFAEAAELDRERVGRWAQLHAVQTAFWGRRHGYRRGRTGAGRDQLISFVDTLVDLLTSPCPDR
ncbi:aminoglycoside phosphotransferase family protein [Kribbella sp. NPDC056861]|uniref:aminoglycoside phosphotransferase family protein n=1 Tax=Kribbella sp. NPDC056861 TaxID=3154857 RepID=UPI003443B20E